jgi:hypothetical protein
MHKYIPFITFDQKYEIVVFMCLSLDFDLFSRTTWPILTRLGTNHLGGRGFRIVQMKDNTPAQGEIIAKQ